MLNGLSYLYTTNFHDEEVKKDYFNKLSLTPKSILVNSSGLTKIVPLHRSDHDLYCAPDRHLIKGVKGQIARDAFSVGVIALRM